MCTKFDVDILKKKQLSFAILNKHNAAIDVNYGNLNIFPIWLLKCKSDSVLGSFLRS